MSEELTVEKLEELTQLAKNIRVDIISMLAKAGSGHPGGSLSSVEIMVALFFHLMNIDPENPELPERDRFHLSKGHGCPALYAALARRGYFSQEKLNTIRQLGSILQGHPHHETPGVDVASGSLGQGLSIACGMAIGSRLAKQSSVVYTLLGDGELQEGQVWEAATFAAHNKLDNLYVFVDYNKLQIDGPIEEVMNIPYLAERWKVFGFEVMAVDGHSIEEIINAVEALKKVSGKPKVIVANTIKGKGVSFMENNVAFHGKATTEEETKQALEELNN
ncbi:MAG: transketolase [Candidatus Heimdallarchaeota archaeon]|nr:transketolase [Candidatus Heimdallarchaeota archaeon]